MAEYIERGALDKALTIAAANGKDKDRRTWAKAICVLHDMPTADVAPIVHGEWLDSPFESIWPGDFDEHGDFIVHTYMAYKCSRCGREISASK